MLYKVTPMMVPPKKQAREPQTPRKKRKTAIYDGEGNEVLITLMCLKCKSMKPLAQFGLRKMADGAIRNQPWCRTCRGGAGVKKDKAEAPVETAETVAPLEAQAEPAIESGVEPAADPVVEPLPLPHAPQP